MNAPGARTFSELTLRARLLIFAALALCLLSAVRYGGCEARRWLRPGSATEQECDRLWRDLEGSLSGGLMASLGLMTPLRREDEHHSPGLGSAVALVGRPVEPAPPAPPSAAEADEMRVSDLRRAARRVFQGSHLPDGTLISSSRRAEIEAAFRPLRPRPPQPPGG